MIRNVGVQNSSKVVEAENVVDFNKVAQNICDDLGWVQYDLSLVLANTISSYVHLKSLEEELPAFRSPAYAELTGFSQVVKQVMGERYDEGQLRKYIHDALEL